MNVLEPTKYLVNKELDMIIRKFLSLDDIVQVCTHQMCDHVNILNTFT